MVRLQWILDEESGCSIHRADQMMLTAFEEHASLDELGRKARALVEERANWERNCRKIEDAYRLALTARGTAARVV